MNMDFNYNIYEDMLSNIIDDISIMLDTSYYDAVWDLAFACNNISFVDGKYKLSDYPELLSSVNSIIDELNAQTFRIINSGIASSFALSNQKNLQLAKLFFKGKLESFIDELEDKFQQTNIPAINAFLGRKTNGMNLSDRVWHYTDIYKKEMERALRIGIGNGISAKDISQYMVQYLRNPSATILEVDNKGIAKEIPTPQKGIGIYRDPKANAMRLARTETNMAYRTADYERWKQLDFVVGYEVHLSHNHTTMKNGKPVRFVDVCDYLQGKYPKDFKFVGWHPQCRCYATPILKSKEEMDSDDEAILSGNEVSKKSKNSVKDAPKNFYDWVSENRERLSHSKSLPFFIRDNKKYVNNVRS